MLRISPYFKARVLLIKRFAIRWQRLINIADVFDQKSKYDILTIMENLYWQVYTCVLWHWAIKELHSIDFYPQILKWKFRPRNKPNSIESWKNRICTKWKIRPCQSKYQRNQTDWKIEGKSALCSSTLLRPIWQSQNLLMFVFSCGFSWSIQCRPH